MRLWSLHPSMLDAKGLVALWREGLLAQHVLLGKTRGYKHHPQLHRFNACRDPVAAIAGYLWAVQAEAVHRGYRFDASKIARGRTRIKIKVTRGQMAFEFDHLLKKVRQRDRKWLENIDGKKPQCHPLFTLTRGKVAAWERGNINP